ncbi:hypothetical protein GCM10010978_05990 [Compostibacillus humi]|uniref:Uncharacterized protein n=1 Tax=Compostibacillus humi TaxID=1245525 RepID=A0A8J2ZQI6_9BACI|nr:hypothetical protein [Compostibacillus humi]GGH70745.1 hypothetical protein GCM10010978_05990 [Compostibacillus humi]
MGNQNLHEQLQQASRNVKEAQEAVLQAQGQDLALIEVAQAKLEEAEQVLEQLQQQFGTEATENPQFQQAFESLHDTRQQAQEAQQNITDIL